MQVTYRVSGRVQGVGFRFFVVDRAHALGIRGTVANLPDGRVEVVAVADARVLGALEAELWRGPGGSRVTNVEKTEILDEGECFSTFEIIRLH